MNLLNAGHGMPLSVRGRSASSVFRSPKLLFPLAVSQDGLSAKTRSKRVLNQSSTNMEVHRNVSTHLALVLGLLSWVDGD